jgi:molybdate transport system permease protein
MAAMEFLQPGTPLWLTLKVAFLATLAALFMGGGLAYALARWSFPGREVLDALLTLPLVMPPTVLGYYLLVLIGRRGPLGQLLQELFGVNLMFTWQGAVVAAAVAAFPLVFKSARAALEGVGRSYEDAARTLGLGEWAVFLRVSLPLALKGVLAGTMLAFARAMGEFGATLMVAGNLPGRTQTLSLAVYSAVQAGDDVLAGTLVVIISVVCVTILVGASQLVKVHP